MPIYLYQHPKTGEIKEVIQGMTETHEYSVGKVKWKRVFTVPQGVVDGKLDAFSRNAFDEKVYKTKNSLGDVWSRSAELSEKRAEKRDGVDPVKKNLYDSYRKKTGKEHPNETREKIAKINITI